MSDSVKEWLLRLSSYIITFLYLSIPIISTLLIISPKTLHYFHLFIQLGSFTICTLVYRIITIILFSHLHFTITFRQTTNSACAHQLRLAHQYDMHITSYLPYVPYECQFPVNKTYIRWSYRRLVKPLILLRSLTPVKG